MHYRTCLCKGVITVAAADPAMRGATDPGAKTRCLKIF